MRGVVCGLMALALAGSAGAMQSAAPPGSVTSRTAASSAAEAPAQAQQPTPPQDTRPRPQPTLADLFPADAKAKNLAGRTRMSCRVNADGTLGQCVVVYECPGGAGFGRAALEAARFFKMRPKTIDGHPASGGTVIVPITWKLDGASEMPAECQSPPVPAAAPSPQAVSNPDWVRMPTGDDLARVYPRPALSRGLSGHTKMSCKVRKDGTLTDCAIVQEDPPGYGFGDATLAVAQYFKMTPTTADGKSVEGGTVIIPIAWRVAQ